MAEVVKIAQKVQHIGVELKGHRKMFCTENRPKTQEKKEHEARSFLESVNPRARMTSR